MMDDVVKRAVGLFRKVGYLPGVSLNDPRFPKRFAMECDLFRLLVKMSENERGLYMREIQKLTPKN
jgi:hypothetical protein